METTSEERAKGSLSSMKDLEKFNYKNGAIMEITNIWELFANC